MVTSIDVTAKEASLVFDPIPSVDDGIYSLIAPDGSEWYKNVGYDTDSFAAPDFAQTDAPFVLAMPLDMYGQIKQTDASTFYIINLKLQSDPTPQEFKFKYSKVSIFPTINAPVQDCTNSSTTITYNKNLPSGVTFLSQLWTITNPNGVVTTQSGATLTLTPLVSGTYQIELTVTYSYTSTIGSSEVSVTDRAVVPFNYVNTCGNSLTLLCKVNCFLGKAIAANNQTQILQLSALASYIWGNIQCPLQQTASQPMFDLVMQRLQLDPSKCDCGGCD